MAALEESADPKMIFAEISEVEKEYPIPAAFQHMQNRFRCVLDRINTDKRSNKNVTIQYITVKERNSYRKTFT